MHNKGASARYHFIFAEPSLILPHRVQTNPGPLTLACVMTYYKGSVMRLGRDLFSARISSVLSFSDSLYICKMQF